LPHVVYRGPFESVDIPALGVTAKRDEPIEVYEGAALALAAQDDWETVDGPSAAPTVPVIPPPFVPAPAVKDETETPKGEA